MSSEPVHVRPQHLQRLGQFSLTLAEVLEQSAIAPDKLREVVRSAWSGECVQCGIQVTGEEMLALSKPAEAGEANPRVTRLRQGNCARNRCDSYYYRLIFTGHPENSCDRRTGGRLVAGVIRRRLELLRWGAGWPSTVIEISPVARPHWQAPNLNPN